MWKCRLHAQWNGTIEIRLQHELNRQRGDYSALPSEIKASIVFGDETYSSLTQANLLKVRPILCLKMNILTFQFIWPSTGYVCFKKAIFKRINHSVKYVSEMPIQWTALQPQNFFWTNLLFSDLKQEKGKRKEKERKKWNLEACSNIFLLNPSELNLLHLKLHG